MHLAAAALLALAGELSAQSFVYATHDWQNASGVDDQWADVKQPGNGRRYSVGTTYANPHPTANPQFSNGNCKVPGTPFQITAGGRQVAVLQVTDESGTTLNQAYFFGYTPSGLLQTFARAIAVHPGLDDQDTRIVICGDTFDDQLPLAATGGFYQPGASQGMGFLAVYNGECDLLWSYQFYGEQFDARTAVTDVAIHYDAGSQEDVVTYCGCSTNGVYDDPSSTHVSTMAPLAPFDAHPGGTTGCNSFTDGDTHNAPTPQTAAGDYDGFVGRLRCSHAASAPSAVSRSFHSVVGGRNREGLFGLALLDDNRFAVTGVLDLSVALAHPSVNGLCPLTRPYYGPTPTSLCLGTAASSTFGITLLFDASTVPTINKLSLVASTLIGSEGRFSVARDIAFQGNRLFVVGSTEDPLLASTVGHGDLRIFLPQYGQRQGYVLATGDLNNGFEMASFSGWTNSNLGGVSGWPANPDHVSVVGWGRDAASSIDDDLLFGTLWVDESGTSPLLRLLHSHVVESNGIDRSGASEDLASCSFVGSEFDTSVGRTAGGGIACDAMGRITAVGLTVGSASFRAPFPLTGPGRGPQAGHGALAQEPDAVVCVMDMLPRGVARTDGSGFPPPSWTIAPGANGGTTPLCALTANGEPIEPMLIDYHGDEPGPGVSGAVLIDRPPSSIYATLGALQFDFPIQTPFFPLGQGVEVWVSNSSTPGTLVTLGPTNQSLRLPLAPFPSGSHEFTVQFSCLMTSPVCTGTSPVDYVASPGMLLWY